MGRTRTWQGATNAIVSTQQGCPPQTTLRTFGAKLWRFRSLVATARRLRGDFGTMALHRIRPFAPRRSATADDASFIESVAARLGEPKTADLERQILVVLSLIGARLPPADAKAVAERLPRRLGRALTAGERGPDDLGSLRKELDERSVSERVCRATCQSLAVAVGEQGRAHLRVQPLGQMFGLRSRSN